jgi:hypothetical protein
MISAASVQDLCVQTDLYYCSHDGGNSWVKAQQDLRGGPLAVSAVHFLDGEHGYVLSEDASPQDGISTMWTTADAGKTWTSHTIAVHQPGPLSESPTPTASITQSVIPQCGDALSIEPGQETAAAGHGARTLVFTNTGAIYCVVSGYPTVGYVNPQNVAEQTLSGYVGGLTNNVTPQTFELAPGDQVSALVEWENNASEACPDPHMTESMWVAVPAGSKRAFSDPIGTCLLEVHPFVAGTTGSDS